MRPMLKRSLLVVATLAALGACASGPSSVWSYVENPGPDAVASVFTEVDDIEVAPGADLRCAGTGPTIRVTLKIPAGAAPIPEIAGLEVGGVRATQQVLNAQISRDGSEVTLVDLPRDPALLSALRAARTIKLISGDRSYDMTVSGEGRRALRSLVAACSGGAA
jgi:hypothetical protein